MLTMDPKFWRALAFSRDGAVLVTDLVGDCDHFVHPANRRTRDAGNKEGSCCLVVDSESSDLEDRSSVGGD